MTSCRDVESLGADVQGADDFQVSDQFFHFAKPQKQCRLTLRQHCLLVEDLPTAASASATSASARARALTDKPPRRIDAADIVGCHCMQAKPAAALHSTICSRSDGTSSSQQQQSIDVYICLYVYTRGATSNASSTATSASSAAASASSVAASASSAAASASSVAANTSSTAASGALKRRTFVFGYSGKDSFQANLRVAAFWRTLIQCVCRQVSLSSSLLSQAAVVTDLLPVVRPLLVLVNPKSGPGHALQLFRQRVVPVLCESDVSYDVVVTSRAGEARQIAAERDLSQWSAVVIVSGDGLLYEVYNGLLSRPDWHRWMNYPVALIPAGSGNGMAASIAHVSGLMSCYLQNPVVTASLTLAKRTAVPVDLMTVRTAAGKDVVGFLSLGWGLLADIDIESERLRALGGARFTVWAAARLLSLRTYRGTIHYLPADDTASPHAGDAVSPQTPAVTTTPLRTRSATFDCRLDSAPRSAGPQNSVPSSPTTASSVDNNEFHNFLLDKVAVPSLVDTTLPADTADNKCDGQEQMDRFRYPPLDQPPPDNWSTITGEFVQVYGSLTSHISMDGFMNPDAGLSDGFLHLHVLRAGLSRRQLLKYLTSLETGRLVRLPFVEVYRVRAVRLVPEPAVPGTGGGYITVDGEAVPHGPVQAEVHRAMGRVLVANAVH